MLSPAFVPRRRGELTFEGEMWIDTLTLGLKHVEAKISEGANVNFVRNYTWSQTYERLTTAGSSAEKRTWRTSV